MSNTGFSLFVALFQGSFYYGSCILRSSLGNYRADRKSDKNQTVQEIIFLYFTNNKVILLGNDS